MLLPRQFMWLAALVVTVLTAEAAYENWNNKDIRVFAEGKTADGKVVPIADSEVLIWKDTPELQDKLDEALRRYKNKFSYSRNPYKQMTWMVLALGDPDIRRTTDMNGNAFFDGARVDEKVLCIVVNIAPGNDAGGVYAGVKRPMELRAVCKPVNQRGLADAMAAMRFGYSTPPMTPHQKEQLY